MKGRQGFGQVSAGLSSANPWGHWLMVRSAAITRRIARWYQLGQERRALAAMSDASLKDLGLSRADIYAESERPFWDDPLNK